jgi:glycosyltransferase involved in cell wall biosynthesis
MTPAAVALNTILVVIPALNEAATIGDVVRSLQTVGLFRICIVDNGSGDRTIAIARPAGTEGVVEPIQGYGVSGVCFSCCWNFRRGGLLYFGL